MINLHTGSAGLVSKPSKDSLDSLDSAVETPFFMSSALAVTDWIAAGIPVRFPRLRIAVTEAGISWVPCSWNASTRRRSATRRRRRGTPVAGSRAIPPRRRSCSGNLYFTSIEGRFVFERWSEVPVDHVMVARDYPHADGNGPNIQDVIRAELARFSVDSREKICFRNAAALYCHPPPSAPWMARVSRG
ncbi:MAG: amidohydrolase family protein [Acidimicrobiales bacterium]